MLQKPRHLVISHWSMQRWGFTTGAVRKQLHESLLHQLSMPYSRPSNSKRLGRSVYDTVDPTQNQSVDDSLGRSDDGTTALESFGQMHTADQPVYPPNKLTTMLLQLLLLVLQLVTITCITSECRLRAQPSIW